MEKETAYVWQVRDRNSGFWLADTRQGWSQLVSQEKAGIWRREDLAEKALKKVLKQWKKVLCNQNQYTWFKGFTCLEEVVGQDEYGHDIYNRYKKVDFEVVCVKLVIA